MTKNGDNKTWRGGGGGGGNNSWGGEEDKNGQSILLGTHQGLATWVFVEIDFTEVISSCHQLFNIMRAATSIYVCTIGTIRPNT